MRYLLVCITICLIACSATQVLAEKTYEFSPTPIDLWELDHHIYATWGINWTLPQGEVITSARIKFYKIYNWENNETNNLYIHLLDSAPDGVFTGSDPDGSTDHFAGQGYHLGTYQDNDGPSTVEDKSYYVPTNKLSWLADGNFGFGVDPDCHYYNCGVKVKITTTCVPEPASIGAFACGLTGLSGFAMRRRRSR